MTAGLTLCFARLDDDKTRLTRVVSQCTMPVLLCSLASWCHKLITQSDKFPKTRHIISLVSGKSWQ